MTNRESALEQALGAVVTVAFQLGINVTLLDKAKAELLEQAGAGGERHDLVAEAIHEIELLRDANLT